MYSFSSSDFLERLIPFSEKLNSLLTRNLSECVLWESDKKEYIIDDNAIVEFSKELIGLELPKQDLIHSALLVIVNRSSVKEQENEEWIIQDKKILIFLIGSLELVKTGQHDIVFWFDIVFEMVVLLRKSGLISFTKWICTCFDVFEWSIANPNIPFESRIESSKGTHPDSNSQIGTDSSNQSPSIAVQRQLAQAKFVGLLKTINKRLMCYGSYREAGKLRSFVYSILPSNQAGICRKVSTQRGYTSYDLKDNVKRILEACTSSFKEDTNSDAGTEKEEGEMVCEKEENEQKLSGLKRIVDSSRFIEYVFDSYLKVDHFFQTPYEFLGSVEGENLDCNERAKIDEISKDIETVIMYFEEYRVIDYFNINKNTLDVSYLKDSGNISVTNAINDFHLISLESKFEGTPSAFDFSYFRFNFAYRLSFLICSYFQLNNSYKSTNEYILCKLTPLLKKCLASLDKQSMEYNFSIVSFINQMLKYELFWSFWRNDNCVDVKCRIENIRPTFTSDDKSQTSPNQEVKRRKVQEDIKTTKYISHEIFNKYIDFVENDSKLKELCRTNEFQKEHLGDLVNIKKPNLSKEREHMFLEPIDLDKYMNKSMNKKILCKFNDYKEKILIDLNPENGIEDSEKSIKDPLFKWRCDRLFKRFKLENLNSLTLLQFSVNNLEFNIFKPETSNEDSESTKVDISETNNSRSENIQEKTESLHGVNVVENQAKEISNDKVEVEIELLRVFGKKELGVSN